MRTQKFIQISAAHVRISRMSHRKRVSRRKFIASTSALVIGSQLAAMKSHGQGSKPKLALDGGERAVKKATPKARRWGDPEREQLNAAVAQDNLLYWNSPQTRLLIERFKTHCPLKHVMTCSSGTASLHIAIAAAGIQPGDEVITAPITDIGTVIGVLFQQAVPVFADLEPNTYNLDPKDVERRITPKTKAIIAVHLGGNPCRLTELRTLADKHKLILIEDCAQSWGAMFNGKPIGTIGHIACFSLQNSKQITCGDGGIVASSDERIGPLLQPYGDKGMDRTNPKLPTEFLAANYRMSELLAGFAAAQMTRLASLAERRAQLGNLLTEKLLGVPGITTHKVDSNDRCTYWFYMLRVVSSKLKCNREKFVQALRTEGVEASAGYIPELIFEKPMFQKHTFFNGHWPVKQMGLTSMDYSKQSCPEASEILKTCLRVPITEAMDEEYIASVAAGIRKVAEHFSV
jgi:perosamine synthetase